MSSFFRSCTIGICSGLRSVTPPAAVSWAATSGRLDLPRPLSVLARPDVTSFLLLSALGEMMVDKLPFVPSRTLPPVLAWRIVTGAVLGAALAFSADDGVPLGGMAGAAGAAAGAHGGVALRSALARIPGVAEPFPGILGDALAAALSLWAVET